MKATHSLSSVQAKYHVEFDIDFRRNKYPGKLIALEGIDGSGKTTQAALLVKELKKLGHKVIQTKEPTQGPIGSFIYKILWGEINIPANAMQYLFVADRAAHAVEIEKHLKEGTYVILDRSLWSSVPYGIFDMQEVDDYYLSAYSILSFYHRFIVPNITIYLNIDPQTGFQRVEGTGKKKEMYKDPEKMVKIKKGYDFLLKKFPKEFTVLDGNRSIEKVTQEIVEKIKAL